MLAHLDLPAGNWIVNTRLNFINDGASPNQVICQVNGSYAEQGYRYLPIGAATTRAPQLAFARLQPGKRGLRPQLRRG